MFTRRKYPRFPVSGSAVVRTAVQRIEFPGSVEMCSKGGVGIYTDVMIAEGTPISLEIDIDTGSESSKIRMNGVVKNYSEWGEKGLLGVAFDKEISEDNEPHLYHYLGILEKEFISEYKGNN
jgi:hypothetical protein